jgi:hypothetical protein
VFQFRCVDLRDGFADFFLVEGPLLRSWTCLSDRVGGLVRRRVRGFYFIKNIRIFSARRTKCVGHESIEVGEV